MKASLLFRLHNSEGVPIAEGGVNATTVPATRFVTFAEQGEGRPGNGVAYANPSARFLSDPRNKLFKDYLRFLEQFQLKAFLFENVPGLLSLGNGRVFRQILREFDEHGYHVTFKILFAAHYGVPQERWRLILLGSRLAPVAAPERNFGPSR